MKPEVRKYKMSDSELLFLAENLKRSAVRDLTDLEDKGVTKETLNKLQSAIYDFSAKPTDEELSKQFPEFDLNNNYLYRQYLLPTIRSYTGGANNTSTEHYAGTSESAISEPSKISTRSPLEELSTEGITPEMLEQLGANPAVKMQFEAIKQRDFAVYDRISAGNALFSMMISLAAKGKQHWYELGEKKYNDYNTAENYINNWQCTDGSIGPGSVVNISVTPVSEATVFTLINNGSTPLYFFFAGSPSQHGSPSQVELVPGNSQSFTSCALGYNEDTMKTRLNVYNDNALPGKYLVEWV